MTEWRPFHRAAVLFETLRALREGALPILLIALLNVARGGLDVGDLTRALIYVLIGAVAATVVGTVRWSTTLWRLTETSIDRREGIFSRRERSVPLARVQSLDAVHGPLQRLFRVSTLQVQTGTGGKQAEIMLTALAAADAAAVRAAAGGEPAVAEPGEQRVAPARRLRAVELLLAAVTAGQAGAVVAVGAVAAQAAGEFAGDGDGFELFERLAPESAAGWVAVGALLMAAAWLIAIAGTLVAFAGFTLTRDGDRLRVRRGLVSVRESAIPVRRVQAVRVVEGVLRQPLGLAAVRVETLGHGDEPPANQTLFPLLRRRDVPALLAEFLPEQADGLDGLRRPPRRALPRYVLPFAAVAAAVAVPAALVFADEVGWWPLLAVLAAAALGWSQWAAAGWRLAADGRAVLRERVLARSTLLFATGRAKTAVVGQSLLQRRAGLADFAVSVGPATGRVRGVEAATAWRLWQAARPPGPG